MSAKATCPACSRETEVRTYGGRPVAGQVCPTCNAPMDAARVARPPAAPPAYTVHLCSVCGEQQRVPHGELGMFEARGMRCRGCAKAQDKAEASDPLLAKTLDEMLAATHWENVPLAKKAAILAEVLR